MSENLSESVSRFLSSPALKFFVIGGLILLLQIPLLLVWALVQEREQSAQGVRHDVARVWGLPQDITGPFLIVPYNVRVRVEKKDKVVEELRLRHAVFLPDILKINGKAATKILTRSIYDVTVYGADLTLEGRFNAPDIRSVEPNFDSVRWRDAIFAVGMSDVSGVKELAELVVDGTRRLAFEPSIGIPAARLTGIHARLENAGLLDGPKGPDAKNGQLTGFGYKISLAFNGSSHLQFSPTARTTEIAVNSDWPHPSFSGAFLPLKRTISNDGFQASWRVPHLARSVPQSWKFKAGFLDRFKPYRFGVRFYIPIDFYDLVVRAVKYGIMFLSVAFVSVFVMEMMSQTRVHVVQYLFTGIAMIFFFVLLLSLSEHLGFAKAYVIAAGATGGMLSLYVGMAMKNLAKGLTMLGLFLILYGLLYLILTLEDYALLAGAVAGFIMLTVMMFATLRVDWSGRRSAAAGRVRGESLAEGAE